MQLLQNFAARVTVGKGKYECASEAMFHLHWLPIRARCVYKLMNITYKSLNGMAQVYLSERLKPKKYNRMTCASDNSVMELAIPFDKKKSFADRGFSSQAPKHWNSLPIELKTCSSLDKFKKDLKHFYLEITIMVICKLCCFIILHFNVLAIFYSNYF